MESPKNIQTKAYVVARQGDPFVLRDIILDEVQPEELLVEIKYTGLCHTDVVVQHGGMPIGRYPAVLGHEGVGTVLHVGSDVKNKSIVPGDTVLLAFHACAECKTCLDGRWGACPASKEVNFVKTTRRGPGAKSPISLPDGTEVHGQFFGQSSLSKMAVVTEKSVVKVDASADELPHLAPLACGYLTGAGTVLNVLKPQPGHSVAVLGMGAVGLAAMLTAKALGAEQIVAVDIQESKLQAASSLGATHTINTANSPDLESALRDIFPGGLDRIVDTTGVIKLLEASARALAHDGTLALVGIPPPTATMQLNVLEFLVGVKRMLIPQLFQLYRDGKFPIDRIATVYPAGELDRAMEDLKSGHVIKPILSWESIPSGKHTVAARI
ncbi:hypothetical protein SLS62_001796 [Diatrype stigma]|uniref:Enoyl reductase (ER) domain-containing protein n=1 Tax=Diatrype stigma TaxID=117547 RepID=A0AAN9V9V5_9PEZI